MELSFSFMVMAQGMNAIMSEVPMLQVAILLLRNFRFHLTWQPLRQLVCSWYIVWLLHLSVHVAFVLLLYSVCPYWANQINELWTLSIASFNNARRTRTVASFPGSPRFSQESLGTRLREQHGHWRALPRCERVRAALTWGQHSFFTLRIYKLTTAKLVSDSFFETVS